MVYFRAERNEGSASCYTPFSCRVRQ
jgi:hypothetical protein